VTQALTAEVNGIAVAIDDAMHGGELGATSVGGPEAASGSDGPSAASTAGIWSNGPYGQTSWFPGTSGHDPVTRNLCRLQTIGDAAIRLAFPQRPGPYDGQHLLGNGRMRMCLTRECADALMAAVDAIAEGATTVPGNDEAPAPPWPPIIVLARQGGSVEGTSTAATGEIWQSNPAACGETDEAALHPSAAPSSGPSPNDDYHAREAELQSAGSAAADARYYDGVAQREARNALDRARRDRDLAARAIDAATASETTYQAAAAAAAAAAIVVAATATRFGDADVMYHRADFCQCGICLNHYYRDDSPCICESCGQHLCYNCYRGFGQGAHVAAGIWTE
jgi:hypothetical protein